MEENGLPDKVLFHWADYVVFCVMLLISASIGVYHGFRSKKNPEQFLMAGKSMTPFPVAMSLIASFISAIGLLGIPSEVYSHGSMYMWCVLSFIFVFPAIAAIYLPVFWELEVTSAYEYLEMRFHMAIRILTSILFLIYTLLYMAIVLYTPALALMQVTGFSYMASISLICSVCIFYTTIGGIKAVLWTDVMQMMIIFLSLAVVYTKGIIDAGGISAVWDINSKYGRIEFNVWDLDPTVRHTVWGLVIGGYFQWVQVYGCNQTQIQRYFCLRSKRMVYKALFINMIGMIIIVGVCCLGGLIAFSRYYQCNPLDVYRITKGDQILALYVMDVFKGWNGIPGLFVAGIFSGSLSTLSSGLNSLAAITLEDLIKRPFNVNFPDKIATYISMGLSVFYGLVTFGIVFIVDMLGKNVVTITITVFGMIGGPVLGVFTLGVLFPMANTKGAGVGILTSLMLTFWLGVGNNIEQMYNRLVTPTKPFLDGGCEAMYPNATIREPVTAVGTEDVLYVYKISYLWLSIIGAVTVIVVGLVVSLLTGGQDQEALDYRTISPVSIWIKRKLSRLWGGKSTVSQIELQKTRPSTKGEENRAYQ